MNPLSDLDINREIRRILVRHWVDLGRLSIRTTSSVSYIRGSLLRISGVSEPFSAPIVAALFTEIQRIRGIRRVNVELDNWADTGGGWRPVEKSAVQAKTSRLAAEADGGTFTIRSGSGGASPGKQKA